MVMDTKERKGQFEVIESFAIRRRKEFYLIGQLKEGEARENWFVNIDGFLHPLKNVKVKRNEKSGS